MEDPEELIVFDGERRVTGHVCHTEFEMSAARAQLAFSLHLIEIRLQNRPADKMTVAGAQNEAFRPVRVNGEAEAYGWQFKIASKRNGNMSDRISRRAMRV